MSWAWVIAIIAAVMAATMAGFALYLWRLLTNVYAEVVVLGRRAGQLAELLGELDLTPVEQGAQPRPRPGDLGGETVGAGMSRPERDDGSDEW